MIALYLLFNIFSLITLNYLLAETLDARIRHEIEHLFFALEYKNNELVVLYPNELKESDLVSLTEDPFFLQVYDLDGNILLQSKNIDLYHPIPIRIPQEFNEYFFEDIDSEEDQLRSGYYKILDEESNYKAILQLSSINTGFNKLTKSMIYFNLFTFPLVLLIIIIVSVFLAKKSFTRINEIIDLAKEITAANLSQRLTYDANPNDEIGKLKDTLNILFERLEKQITQISHFTDNASHQLMTPLTTLNTELDFILKKEREPKEYDETLRILKEQTQRMITIVKTMLILAKDCNECSDNKSVFNLSKLLNEETKKVYNYKRIKFSIEPDIFLRGKSEYFSLVINNLIDNAIKYSKDNSPILVKSYKENNSIFFEVHDHGIGIDDKEKNIIFDRFYRGMDSDNSGIKGYGLGLSLVYSIISSMGGKIVVEDNNPSGAIFITKLPFVEFG